MTNEEIEVVVNKLFARLWETVSVKGGNAQEIGSTIIVQAAIWHLEQIASLIARLAEAEKGRDEAVRIAIEQCPCTPRERLSGHLADCYVHQLEAVAKGQAIDAAMEGEK